MNGQAGPDWISLLNFEGVCRLETEMVWVEPMDMDAPPSEIFAD